MALCPPFLSLLLISSIINCPENYSHITILIPCYFAFFESSKRQGTLGKCLLNIKVIRDDSRGINFIEAFWRFIIALVVNLTVIFYILSIIAMLFNKDGKMLHDIFLNTKVVKR
ncbi:MAG: RDD family protein [Rickettsia sp.]